MYTFYLVKYIILKKSFHLCETSVISLSGCTCIISVHDWIQSVAPDVEATWNTFPIMPFQNSAPELLA